MTPLPFHTFDGYYADKALMDDFIWMLDCLIPGGLLSKIDPDGKLPDDFDLDALAVFYLRNQNVIGPDKDFDIKSIFDNQE